ncbi:MAG: DUF4395 family protein [Thermincolia bacterium]
MKEIPVPYIKANQIGIVSVVVLAIITQQLVLIAGLLIVQVAGLLLGLKGNLFIQLAKPFLIKDISQASTQSQELSRFNNVLAVIFLTLSLLFFALGLKVIGYI